MPQSIPEEVRIDTWNHHIRFNQNGMIDLHIVPANTSALYALIFTLVLISAFGSVGLVVGVIATIAVYLVVTPRTKRRRGAIARLSTEDLVATFKGNRSFQLVLWSSVVRGEFTGRKLVLLTESRKYAMRVSKSHTKAIKELLKRELGQKLEVA